MSASALSRPCIGHEKPVLDPGEALPPTVRNLPIRRPRAILNQRAVLVLALLDALHALLRRAGHDQAVLRTENFPSASAPQTQIDVFNETKWASSQLRFGPSSIHFATYRASHRPQDLARPARRAAQQQYRRTLQDADGALDTDPRRPPVCACRSGCGRKARDELATEEAVLGGNGIDGC